ncbi:MAG: hypothetical protein AAB885_03975 [Patescibacteria group bacterium]
MKSNPHNRGYIAITSAIILSFLIMAVSIALSSSAILTRLSVLDLTAKRSSFFVARTCLERALLELALDGNYAGNTTVVIEEGGNQCTLYTIESSPPNKIIKARAQITGVTTNLKLTVDSTTLATVSFEEVGSF